MIIRSRWTSGVANECGSQFDDGREVELLHFVYGHQSINSIRGSPSGVLNAVDEYGRTKNYLMNVGELKGKIVTDLIAETKPQTMVELGGYVGYSAILFADALRKAGGKRYFSLERNAVFAAVIMALVDLAGLADVVKVIVGPSADSIKRLHAENHFQKIDMLFLDHYKPAYTPDLKLCEQLRLITPGSVLVADNVIAPGNPPYLEYVRSSVDEKRRRAGQGNGTAQLEERFSDRTANQYAHREGTDKLDNNINGNPNLRYESRLVESFEPTGRPVG